ncbi:PREDICTED: uncharacterized protein LOC109245067 [Nicotiana attenuata]|uniref:uncharacterized protein LOC109245067 n=1 Tax=Nicotiana attenuata TaxID=49451 RepID=UPI0009051ECF|nr:PREDICTED: uncharacterized protein LOC109245067 [Nicotiana attenuata]
MFTFPLIEGIISSRFILIVLRLYDFILVKQDFVAGMWWSCVFLHNGAKVRPRVKLDHGAKLDRRDRDPETDQDRDRPRSRPSKIEIEQDRGELTEPNNEKPKHPQSGEDHGRNPGTYQEEAG